MEQQIRDLEIKIDKVFESVEKTRKYFLIIIWVTVIGFAVPLIGLFFAIPSFLSIYTNLSNF